MLPTSEPAWAREGSALASCRWESCGGWIADGQGGTDNGRGLRSAGSRGTVAGSGSFGMRVSAHYDAADASEWVRDGRMDS